MADIKVVRKASRTSDGAAVGERSVSISLPDSRYRMIDQIVRAYRVHSWTNATVNVIGRSLVGSWWKIVEDDDPLTNPTNSGRRRIEDFLSYKEADYTNIKDFVNLGSKLAQTGMLVKLTGQCAWEIIRRGGKPVGFDVISGYIKPNVDEYGNLLSPAFLVYPWGARDRSSPVAYDAEDIVYFFNPGVTGDITGESVYEALAVTAIPSDLSAGTTYRELFYNVNAPYNGVWEVDSSVDDDDFDRFVDLLEDRYSGPENFGRNPLVIRGRVEFKQTVSRTKDDAPYLEGRRYTQEEISAVTGVDGNKMGISDSSNKANMRETRREYHENVMRPLTNWLEDEIYRQVFVRILGVKGWKLVFNRPDFMNALEQSTIDSRDIFSGIVSPNEVRLQRGMRERPGGDVFKDSVQGRGGKSPERGPDEDAPDDSSRGPQAERPPRDEEDTSKSVSLALKELRAWRKYYLRALDGKVAEKEFVCRHIDDGIAAIGKRLLLECGSDFSSVKKVFDAISIALEELYGNEADNE